MSEGRTAQHLTSWHQGRRDSLDALLERNLPWILGRVRQRIGPGLRKMVESSDIVQEAAIQFLQYAPNFVTSDEGRFRGLLARIIENVLRDKNDWFTAKRREIARQKPLPSDTVLDLDGGVHGGKTPCQSVMRHEQEAWIRFGMEFLDSGDREVLSLRQWDGLSFADVGARLGISENAAWMRHSRAVGKLARIVGRLRRGETISLLNNTPEDS